MLAHRLLGGCNSSLCISQPSLVSMLIAVSPAHLQSSFRRCSESPLLTNPKTMVSCLLGVPDFFLDSLLTSCGTLAPFRLCSLSQPQSSPWDLIFEARASAPSPCLPQRVSRKPLRLVSAGQHGSSVQESLRFALYTPVAVLSSMAPKLPPNPTPVSSSEGAS